MDKGLQYFLDTITFTTSVHIWGYQFRNRIYVGILHQDRTKIVCD